MSDNLLEMRKRFARMMAISTAISLVAVGFAIAHFVYGVGWALWVFVGLLAAGFVVQIWFVRGFARLNKGN
jgi:hypothetical protein